jgi:hypothetical protein
MGYLLLAWKRDIGRSRLGHASADPLQHARHDLMVCHALAWIEIPSGACFLVGAGFVQEKGDCLGVARCCLVDELLGNGLPLGNRLALAVLGDGYFGVQLRLDHGRKVPDALSLFGTSRPSFSHANVTAGVIPRVFGGTSW